MRAELASFGYFVSGPHESYFVTSREEIPPDVLADNDYTITEVFAKAWRGALINPDGTVNAFTDEDWDTIFKRQP